MVTRLRFTTAATLLGAAGTVAWEVGEADGVVVIAAATRRAVVDVVPADAVRTPEPDELVAPF